MRGVGWWWDENWMNVGWDIREGGRNFFERLKFFKIWIRKYLVLGILISNLGIVSGVLVNLKYGYKNVMIGFSCC